jgi:Fe2+ or Zn2+ uptake regulation protein
MQSIIRVDHSKENPFLLVCRKTVRDMKLDLQAKGLLVFLLDKPDNWRIRPEAMAKELNVGVATVYRILDRLITSGYVHREVIRRNKNGTYQCGALYTVFEDKNERQEWADRQKFSEKDVRLNGVTVPF